MNRKKSIVGIRHQTERVDSLVESAHYLIHDSSVMDSLDIDGGFI